MKSNLWMWMVVSIVMFTLFVLSGCYTQLGTIRTERSSDTEAYTSSEQANDSDYVGEQGNDDYYDRDGSVINNYYGWYPQTRIGFSYYYPSYYWPSYAFSVAYADPWFYDYNWSYEPWCYSPVYAWNPYYGYSPFYYYYPPYYYSSYRSSTGKSGRRTDGSILSGGNDRKVRNSNYEIPNAARTDFNLPTGASLGRSSSSAQPIKRSTPNVRENSRRTRNLRTYVPRGEGRSQQRTGSLGQGSVPRNGGTEDVRQRDARPQETNSPPPAHYTPPPSPAPRQSSPPPSSSDGSRRTDGNSNGSGDSRGRR